jgi:dGTPase
MNWNDLLSSKRLRPSKRPIEKSGQEPEPTQDIRNPFESDFGRVIFSPATRRMHDKTQVFPLTADDNAHSRLTHSMEVMAIGYSLAIKICRSAEFQNQTGRGELELLRQVPLIIQSSCLVHDIGNPPFGHFGETVIQNYFKKLFLSNHISKTTLENELKGATIERKEEIAKAVGGLFNLTKYEEEDFTNFDGNAQGFRVLTKLQILDDDKGLNLTSATLGSYLKYPNTDELDKTKKIINKKKRGVFQSEKQYLSEIATNCGLIIDGEIKRHPLCFLMEAADSICYLVMDMEDGFNKKWYGYSFIKEKLKSIAEMPEQFAKLEAAHKTNGIDITRVANLRIYLLQRLVDLATKNFLDNIDPICNGKYNKELIDDDTTGLAECLRKFSWDYVFQSRDITSLELTGHSVITGLLDNYISFLFHEDKAYQKRAEGLISNGIKRVALIENGLSETDTIQKLNPYYKLRVIVDYVSGMTDQFALNHYQKLSGQKIL